MDAPTGVAIDIPDTIGADSGFANNEDGIYNVINPRELYAKFL